MKTLNLAVAVLFLVACGGPIARGPLIRPPAPPTLRPGHGLPVLEPGKPQALPPRSPHKRPLPPTAEPGLWAGDGPVAATDDPAPFVELFGVPIASPGLPQERTETARCAEQARLRFDEETYKKRDGTWLRCFANAIIQACLEAEGDKLRALKKDSAATPAHSARLHAIGPAAALAAKEAARLCPTKDAETAKAGRDMREFTMRTEWAQ